MREKPEATHQHRQLGEDASYAQRTAVGDWVVEQELETLLAFNRLPLGRELYIPRQPEHIDLVSSFRQRADFLSDTRIFVDVVMYEDCNTHV